MEIQLINLLILPKTQDNKLLWKINEVNLNYIQLFDILIVSLL